MTIWRMRIPYWKPMATNKHSEYVTFAAFPLQQWLLEWASMLCYMYIACLVYSTNNRGTCIVLSVQDIGPNLCGGYLSYKYVRLFLCNPFILYCYVARNGIIHSIERVVVRFQPSDLHLFKYGALKR